MCAQHDHSCLVPMFELTYPWDCFPLFGSPSVIPPPTASSLINNSFFSCKLGSSFDFLIGLNHQLCIISSTIKMAKLIELWWSNKSSAWYHIDLAVVLYTLVGGDSPVGTRRDQPERSYWHPLHWGFHSVDSHWYVHLSSTAINYHTTTLDYLSYSSTAVSNTNTDICVAMSW